MHITEVEAECGGFPSDSFDFGDERLSFSPIRVVGKDDVGAAPREIDGSVAADTTATTGDDGGLVRQGLLTSVTLRVKPVSKALSD
jgi:hypothetical protein